MQACLLWPGRFKQPQQPSTHWSFRDVAALQPPNAAAILTQQRPRSACSHGRHLGLLAWDCACSHAAFDVFFCKAAPIARRKKGAGLVKRAPHIHRIQLHRRPWRANTVAGFGFADMAQVPPPSVKVTKLKKGERYRGLRTQCVTESHVGLRSP